MTMQGSFGVVSGDFKVHLHSTGLFCCYLAPSTRNSDQEETGQARCIAASSSKVTAFHIGVCVCVCVRERERERESGEREGGRER